MERRKVDELCCHETVMRCWFMVCSIQPSPHWGLCPHPCWCHPPSGQPHLPKRSLKPVQLIQKSAFSHPPQILPCLSHLAIVPLAEFSTLLLVSMAVEGPSLPYFQETIQTCMPNHALSCASHWLVGCPSTHQSGIHDALSELKYVGVTFLSLSLLLSENPPKMTSLPLLPTDFLVFPLYL